MFLVLGISLNFILYVIINVAYVTKLLPTTGLALPFFSYGGSALITLSIGLGIVQSVAINQNKYEY